MPPQDGWAGRARSSAELPGAPGRCHRGRRAGSSVRRVPGLPRLAPPHPVPACGPRLTAETAGAEPSLECKRPENPAEVSGPGGVGRRVSTDFGRWPPRPRVCFPGERPALCDPTLAPCRWLPWFGPALLPSFDPKDAFLSTWALS